MLAFKNQTGGTLTHLGGKLIIFCRPVTSLKEFSLQDSRGGSISETKYNALLKGQEGGKEITPDANGNPALTDPVVDPVVVAEGTQSNLPQEAKSYCQMWCMKPSGNAPI